MGCVRRKLKGPEMEFEEQRVKDMKTNNKKFLWCTEDWEDCERMGRSPGCDTLYLELSVAGLHTAVCKISEENYFRLSDLGLDHFLFFSPL